MVFSPNQSHIGMQSQQLADADLTVTGRDKGEDHSPTRTGRPARAAASQSVPRGLPAAAVSPAGCMTSARDRARPRGRQAEPCCQACRRDHGRATGGSIVAGPSPALDRLSAAAGVFADGADPIQQQRTATSPDNHQPARPPAHGVSWDDGQTPSGAASSGRKGPHRGSDPRRSLLKGCRPSDRSVCLCPCHAGRRIPEAARDRSPRAEPAAPRQPPAKNPGDAGYQPATVCCTP
jgi:hypothetical protein